MYMVVEYNNWSLAWSLTSEKHMVKSIITRFSDKDGNIALVYCYIT